MTTKIGVIWRSPKQRRRKRTRRKKIELLEAKIKDGKATLDSLTEEIAEASEMVEKLTAHTAEAIEIREAGRKTQKQSETQRQRKMPFLKLKLFSLTFIKVAVRSPRSLGSCCRRNQ